MSGESLVLHQQQATQSKITTIMSIDEFKRSSVTNQRFVNEIKNDCNERRLD